jgi:hypothetical protein
LLYLRHMKKLVLVPFVLLFVACGHPVQSKSDAAQASHTAVTAGQTATGDALLQLATQKPGTVITVQGKKGSAQVSFTQGSYTANGLDAEHFEVHVVFSGYSADGKNVFDGTVDQTAGIIEEQNRARIVFTVKGSITQSGDYDSSLTFDETLTVDALDQAQGAKNHISVKVVVDGKVSADGKPYQFNHEEVSVST